MTLKPGQPLRLRSVRLKAGGEIRVLPNSDTSTDYKRKAIEALDALSEPIVGVALVAWSEHNGSVAQMNVSPQSRIPFILVPDFVRNRLLANGIEHWTRETLGKNDC
jgi:hypothetical protein